MSPRSETKIYGDKIYGTVGEDRKPHVSDVQEPMCCILGGSDDVAKGRKV